MWTVVYYTGVLVDVELGQLACQVYFGRRCCAQIRSAEGGCGLFAHALPSASLLFRFLLAAIPLLVLTVIIFLLVLRR